MMKQRTIMQKSLVLLTLLFISYYSNAQFYYNDVFNLKVSNKIYSNLIKNNIREISAVSTERDGTPTKGFAYLKSIKDNGNTVTTHTELETGGVTDDVDTYMNGLLTKSEDSADNVLTTVEYTYDADGKLLTVQTQTDDTAMSTHSTELHKWFYTGNEPDSMIRIKDKTDSTVVRLKKDDHNNVAEELWIKKRRVIEHYFYYYNSNNQLTDIVRFNNKAQQMLPDFLFEYDANGMLSQLTQIPQGSSDYVIWQYIYDERGLKTKDVLFDKRQQLLGTVTYTYR
jgi:hypothetical protein